MRTFCCIIPARLGVLLFAPLTGAASTLCSIVSLYALIHHYQDLLLVPRIFLGLLGSSMALLAIASLLGFVGAVVKVYKAVSFYSQMLSTLWLSVVITGIINLVFLYKDRRDFIESCASNDEDHQAALSSFVGVEKWCDSRFTLGFGFLVATWTAVALLVMYLISIVKRYAQQLSEERYHQTSIGALKLRRRQNAPNDDGRQRIRGLPLLSRINIFSIMDEIPTQSVSHCCISSRTGILIVTPVICALSSCLSSLSILAIVYFWEDLDAIHRICLAIQTAFALTVVICTLIGFFAAITKSNAGTHVFASVLYSLWLLLLAAGLLNTVFMWRDREDFIDECHFSELQPTVWCKKVFYFSFTINVALWGTTIILGLYLTTLIRRYANQLEDDRRPKITSPMPSNPYKRGSRPEDRLLSGEGSQSNHTNGRRS